MSKIAKAKIEFTYDEDSLLEMMGEDATPMTEQELIDYALESYLDDITTLVKYGELSYSVLIEVENT
jgi:hypothetical protein